MNEQEPDVGQGRDAPASDDPQERVRQLLTDLADDPDAPESSVSGLSVIAAARASAGGSQLTRVATVSTGKELDRADLDGSASAGELHVLAVQADAARGRTQRRRTGLIALAVAASVAGIAAIVIPLSVNSGSTTSTAADSAVAGALSGPAASGTAAAAAGTAEGVQPGDAAQDSGQGMDSAAPEAGAAAPERPPPGPDALTELVPLDGVTPPAQPPGATEPAAASCWPALSEDAATALAGALPAGAFGSPTTLYATCGPDPVGGATLVGTAPGTALAVRVSKAEAGACAQGNSEVGVRCIARDGGVYVATDSGRAPVAFAYGNGNEIVVSGPPAELGAISAPPVSGLSADQLVAAAQAVLGAIG